MTQLYATYASPFPYPGLRPFTRDEADIFFGRESQITELLEKLKASRFLAVVGPSGCGKSSLIRAGLIPYLEAGFIVGTGSQWRIAEMRPGHHPMLTLAKTLLQPEVVGPEWGTESDAVPFLAAELRRGPLALVELLRGKPLPENHNLLILVDQFEELFRMEGTLDQDEANKFVDLLLETLKKVAEASHPRELPFYLVLTMRSDFLGDCALFRGLPEAINKNLYLTPRLTREQMEAAIVGPARVCGGDVDPLLLNQLLNEVTPDPDQLPVLQHALMRMWRKMLDALSENGPADREAKTLRPIHYQEIGETLGSSLDNHATEVFEKHLSPTQQPVAQTLFRCLTERAMGQRDRRRPCRLGDIAEVADIAWEEVAAVADVFRGEYCNFVMPPRAEPLTPDTVLDIGHESLIRQWSMLNRWVSVEAQSATTYQRVVREALEWSAGQAGLWQGLNLERIVAWWSENDPKPGWTRRYTLPPEAQKAMHELALAKEFIAASQAEQTRLVRLDKERQDKQKRLKTLIWMLVPAAVLAVVAIAGWVLAISKGRELERQRDEASATARRVGALTLKERADRRLGTQPELAQLLSLEQERLKLATPAAKALAQQDLLPDLTFTPWLKTVLQASAAFGSSVVFSPAGNKLAATVGSDIHLWDLDHPGAPPKVLRGHTDTVQNLVFTPQTGEFLVSASDDGSVRLWDVQGLAPSGEPIQSGAMDTTLGIAFSGDGKYMATSDSDGTVKLWDFGARRLISEIKAKAQDGRARTVGFSPDNKRLVVGYRKRVQMWNVEDIKHPKPLKPIGLPNATEDSVDVAFSPDGRYLAILSDALRLWDIKRQNFADMDRENSDENEKPWSIAFRPDGRVLAQTNLNGTIRLWAIDASEDVRWHQRGDTVKAHSGAVWQGAFSPDGRLYASAGEDGAVKLWDWSFPEPFASGIALPNTISPKDEPLAMGYQDDKQLWIATDGKTLALFDAHTGKRLGQFLANEPRLLRRTTFSGDGTHMAVGSLSLFSRWSLEPNLKPHGTPIRVTDHRAPTEVREFSADGLLRNFVLSREGTKLVAVYLEDRKGGESTIRLWPDTQDEKPTPLVREIDGKIRAIAFSPNGKTLVTVGTHGLEFLDAGTLQEKPMGAASKVAAQETDFGDISAVALNPDETLVALALPDRIRLRETQTGHQMDLSIPGWLRVTELVFSPDGTELISLHNDGSLARWHIDRASLQSTACAVANRNLTCDEWQTYVGDLFREEPYHQTCPNPDFMPRQPCSPKNEAGW